MKETTGTRVPKARKDQLIVQQANDETLVYDLRSDKAHCLNLTAAAVWKSCDGKTTVADMVRQLGGELGGPVDEEVIWLALTQLEKFNLLDEKLTKPVTVVGMSRRELAKRLGTAAVIALPLVISIVAPTAAHALTCPPSGGTNVPPGCPCNGGGNCLPGKACSGAPKVCQP